MAKLADGLRPERVMKWKDKSLAVCSHAELVECIIHLARQIVILEAQVKEFKQYAPIPLQRERPYNERKANE